MTRFEDVHFHDEYCTVEWVGLGRPPVPWCVRFADHIVYSENGCWLWKSAIGKTDSERNRLNFSTRSNYLKEKFNLPNAIDACRWIYTRTIGPIEDGLTIDHAVCENWRCVNPFHLEPVSNAENQRRYAKTRSGWTVRDDKGRFFGRQEVAK